MQKMFWIVGMWLVGIAGGHALTPDAPETLTYDVYWGFVRMGGATLTYVPEGKAYTLKAEVKDETPLIELHDVWQSKGLHGREPFEPQVYSVKQAENTYRADKTLTFDRKAGTVSYVNNLNPADKAKPIEVGDARDALATIYNWRMGGLDEVQKPAEVTIVNLKRPVVLRRDAGTRTTLKTATREYRVWKVNMRTVKDGKPSKDSWTVYLTDDARLVPVQVVAATKFGTFRATLKD
ncbi:MAG: DUF3108 domain-containing protein [Alphaproteobacteria bacterium]|nr:MAG: DUF3108 domain-containing protein [Alphaproteobacteria bacterium]